MLSHRAQGGRRGWWLTAGTTGGYRPGAGGSGSGCPHGAASPLMLLKRVEILAEAQCRGVVVAQQPAPPGDDVLMQLLGLLSVRPARGGNARVHPARADRQRRASTGPCPNGPAPSHHGAERGSPPPDAAFPHRAWLLPRHVISVPSVRPRAVPGAFRALTAEDYRRVLRVPDLHDTRNQHRPSRRPLSCSTSASAGAAPTSCPNRPNNPIIGSH